MRRSTAVQPELALKFSGPFQMLLQPCSIADLSRKREAVIAAWGDLNDCISSRSAERL